MYYDTTIQSLCELYTCCCERRVEGLSTFPFVFKLMVPKLQLLVKVANQLQ
jgi:hypothetical protein